MIKQPPVWIVRMAERLPAPMQRAARQLLLVNYIHLMLLHRLRTTANESSVRLIDRLIKCWPFGLFYSPPAGRRTAAIHPCGYARLCPHCLARQVVDLYEHVVNGPLAGPEPRLMVMARIQVVDSELFHRRDHESLKHIRKGLLGTLVDRVETLGASGGVTTFSIGPSQTDGWSGREREPKSWPGFEFFASVVASIPTTPANLRNINQAVTQRSLTEPAEIAGLVARPMWAFRSEAAAQALRRLLVGGSPASVVNREQFGGVGAFVVPVWPIVTSEQWWHYQAVSSGVRLYDLFGDWRGFHRPARGPRPRRL